MNGGDDIEKLLAHLGLTTASAPEEMVRNVGRIVRFKEWEPTDGTLRRDFSFTIRGLQLNYRGKVCYRVYSNGYNDVFGSVGDPDEIEFVDDPRHPERCSDCGAELKLNPHGFKVCATSGCFLRDTRMTGEAEES